MRQPVEDLSPVMSWLDRVFRRSPSRRVEIVVQSSVDDLKLLATRLVEEARAARQHNAWGRLAVRERESGLVLHIWLPPDAFHFNIEADNGTGAAGFDRKSSYYFSEAAFEMSVAEHLWELLSGGYGLTDDSELPALVEVR
jgi:hypothetical protein